MALLGLMWPWCAKIAQPLLALLYRIFKLKFCQGFLSWSFVNILKLKLSRFWNWRFVKKPAVDNVDKISFDTAYPLGGGWGSAGWWCKKVIWPLFLWYQTILNKKFLFLTNWETVILTLGVSDRQKESDSNHNSSHMCFLTALLDSSHRCILYRPGQLVFSPDWFDAIQRPFLWMAVLRFNWNWISVKSPPHNMMGTNLLVGLALDSIL